MTRIDSCPVRRARALLLAAVAAAILSLGAAKPVGSAEVAACMDVGGEMKPATIVGTPGNDMLSGTPGADVIAGLAGDDTIDGGGGDDLICGGDGNDVLYGVDGADTLTGDAGDDFIDGGAQPTDVADFVAYDGSPAAVTVDLVTAQATGWGTDVVRNVEGISGSDFADTLTGGPANDQIIGQLGNDTLNGMGGDDFLSGSPGNDVEIGGPGEDTAYYWFAPAVNASLATGSARAGSWGRDRLSGIEDLDGSDHADRLTGNGGANYIRGFKGPDVILGGGGPDIIEGREGNDKLDGGPGRDRGLGGPGRDKCRRIERKSSCETRWR